MTKQEDGVLVIEASIALTVFMFMILFFLNFAQVYRAQSVVSHAAFQTSQALAIESFTREKVGEGGTLGAVTKLVDFYANITNSTSARNSMDAIRSLDSLGDPTSILKKEFVNSLADNEAEASAKLKSLGVTGGLDALSFDGSSLSSKEVLIKVTYTVKLRFALFGAKELKLEKTAKSKCFS